MEALKMKKEPQDGGSEVKDHQSVKEILQRYIDNSDKSQTQVAKEIGISGSALSQFLNGTYKGSISNICNAVKKYLNLEKQKLDTPKKPEFVATEIAQEIQTVLSFCRLNDDIGVIVGDPGIGKTMTLKKYADENPNVVLISANPALRSPNSLLDELLYSLGKKETGKLAAKQRSLIKYLSDSGMMIIIDEAQHLTYSSLETIRAIYDATRISLVLAGNPLVLDEMRDKRAEFAQFFSRIGIQRRISGKKKRKDIEKIAKQCITNPSKEIIDFLAGKANVHGGFRYMTKHLVLAMTLAYNKKTTVALEHFKQAERILKG
jgi:hypothetical protein